MENGAIAPLLGKVISFRAYHRRRLEKSAWLLVPGSVRRTFTTVFGLLGQATPLVQVSSLTGLGMAVVLLTWASCRQGVWWFYSEARGRCFAFIYRRGGQEYITQGRLCSGGLKWPKTIGDARILRWIYISHGIPNSLYAGDSGLRMDFSGGSFVSWGQSVGPDVFLAESTLDLLMGWIVS